MSEAEIPLGTGSDGPGGTAFTVGPPGPVTDSRELPAVSAEEEAASVQGGNLAGHPDNIDETEPGSAAVEASALETEAAVTDADPDLPGEDLPGEDELDALLTDVDVEDDDAGFDPGDTVVVPDAGDPGTGGV